MPIDLAPHSDELRAAEVAGGDADPATGRHDVLDGPCVEVEHPVPLEAGPAAGTRCRGRRRGSCRADPMPRISRGRLRDPDRPSRLHRTRGTQRLRPPGHRRPQRARPRDGPRRDRPGLRGARTRDPARTRSAGQARGHCARVAARRSPRRPHPRYCRSSAVQPTSIISTSERPELAASLVNMLVRASASVAARLHQPESRSVHVLFLRQIAVAVRPARQPRARRSSQRRPATLERIRPSPSVAGRTSMTNNRSGSTTQIYACRHLISGIVRPRHLRGRLHG